MQGNGVTFEAVITAANHIRSQGQNPTIEKIRQHLGSGSNTTINKYLKAWRAQCETIDESPTELQWSTDIVKMATEQAWAGIRKEAEAKIASIKDDANLALQQAHEQLKIAQEAEGRAQAELAELHERLNAVLGAKELQSLDLKALQQELALLKERNLGIEKRLLDREQLYNNHMAQVSANHARETQVLNEKCQLIEKKHAAFIDELKTQSEAARHQSMLTLDQLKAENKTLNKTLLAVRESLKEKDLQLAELKAMLKIHLQEREESLSHLPDISRQLAALKTLISELGLATHYTHISQQLTDLQQGREEGLSILLTELKNLKSDRIIKAKKSRG